jgi:hypothetical protein
MHINLFDIHQQNLNIVNKNDDSHLTNSCENLKVFCVSSSEYQKLKNKLTDDGPPKVRK